MLEEASTTTLDVIDALKVSGEYIEEQFDREEYRGYGTCGFAHIDNIDGRKKFVRRCNKAVDVMGTVAVRDRRGDIRIDTGLLEARLGESHSGGYRLSITNVGSFMPGPEHQRIDVRVRLHRLLLDALQERGYLEGATIYSRMD